nr:hypothetical protein ICEMyc226_00233 [Mycolicibacterium sp.]
MGDTAVVEEWCGANRLRADLDALQLPDQLRAQISFRYTYRWDDDRLPWPPQWPGCCLPNYFLGTGRIFGDVRLSEWITLAPWGFGANLDPARARALDTVAARLRAGGEGLRTLWALDLRHPDPAPALAADMLIQFGVHRLVKAIKGRSSRVLRAEFPELIAVAVVVDQLLLCRDGRRCAVIGDQTLRRDAERTLNHVDGAAVSGRVHRRASRVRAADR